MPDTYEILFLPALAGIVPLIGSVWWCKTKLSRRRFIGTACPRCGYSLAGLIAPPVCPECGHAPRRRNANQFWTFALICELIFLVALPGAFTAMVTGGVKYYDFAQALYTMIPYAILVAIAHRAQASGSGTVTALAFGGIAAAFGFFLFSALTSDSKGATGKSFDLCAGLFLSIGAGGWGMAAAALVLTWAHGYRATSPGALPPRPPIPATPPGPHALSSPSPYHPNMTNPLVILCPGQGAQAVSMGKAWHEKSPESQRVFAQADQILGSRLGSPLSKLCFEGPADRLNQTDASQPAIFVTSVASWKGLLAAWGYGNGEASIAATAGLSLGEYTSLHLAGAIDFQSALELVLLRGQAMQDAAQASPGGMVALIGADEAQAQTICDRARAAEVLVCANFNAPGQIVLSGHKTACERAAAVATEMGLRSSMLVVAGAFHSPLMQPAAERLAAALAKTTINAPRCPVISNVTAQPHEADPDSIRRRLVEQLTNPVRWSQSCTLLATSTKGDYHELAPGKTLSGLMRRIDKATKVTTHDEPDAK